MYILEIIENCLIPGFLDNLGNDSKVHEQHWQNWKYHSHCKSSTDNVILNVRLVSTQRSRFQDGNLYSFVNFWHSIFVHNRQFNMLDCCLEKFRYVVCQWENYHWYDVKPTLPTILSKSFQAHCNRNTDTFFTKEKKLIRVFRNWITMCLKI